MARLLVDGFGATKLPNWQDELHDDGQSLLEYMPDWLAWLAIVVFWGVPLIIIVGGCVSAWKDWKDRDRPS